ncbi:MAPEG family protein [Sulfitobacter sp. M57]|uniref:MAPEG family protein n=1 Tax=unclassified Sulfitobacter TaxID=196795 RepID=UPI0023E0A282|nr:MULTISPECIES: MAPEG family protein [unclassified Sulfitobacter]MDF3412851.1 MAPEG family protein [Sulfitobacter sp. KE5]MDF3421865.1 MAPEG family protein [Sulfitobacter sp. KE43]MDF3431400.1 MAPEG family protein [Sulfitobacter sp. KE42]MDF3457041.1 MAPEG family protein [Sulfitobacter sp. S74]MDF3460944.1 MAPEG family protein [Sulfitobacter sp. Ks18]
MTPELTVLTLAAILQIVQFALYAVPANKELGMGYTMSARDTAPTRQISEQTARLGRAFDNHFQGLILFTIAVGVIEMSGQNSGFTALCAWVYLAARTAYIPAYAKGLSPARSYIWFAGLLATFFMLLAALI